MLKKEILSECNFDCPKPAWIDWWLWIQVTNRTNVYCLQDKLTFYRVHGNSLISNEYQAKLQNLKTKELIAFHPIEIVQQIIIFIQIIFVIN